MFNGEYYTPIPEEDSSPSNLRSQGMPVNTTPNDLSASGPGPGPATGSGVQLGTSRDGTHFNFSQHSLAPVTQGAFQQPLPQRNPGGVYTGNGGPSHEPNATATPSSLQGGGDTPITMPYGGLPTALPVPNVPNGQAGNPRTSFQVGQPPAMAWQHWESLCPEVFARPDAQGVPGPIWQLVYAALEPDGGDDLRVIIHFRRIRSPLS